MTQGLQGFMGNRRYLMHIMFPVHLHASSPAHSSIPICSMYGIFTYIWLISVVNVGKYSGAFGISKQYNVPASVNDSIGFGPMFHRAQSRWFIVLIRNQYSPGKHERDM